MGAAHEHAAGLTAATLLLTLTSHTQLETELCVRDEGEHKCTCCQCRAPSGGPGYLTCLWFPICPAGCMHVQSRAASSHSCWRCHCPCPRPWPHPPPVPPPNTYPSCTHNVSAGPRREASSPQRTRPESLRARPAAGCGATTRLRCRVTSRPLSRSGGPCWVAVGASLWRRLAPTASECARLGAFVCVGVGVGVAWQAAVKTAILGGLVHAFVLFEFDCQVWAGLVVWVVGWGWLGGLMARKVETGTWGKVGLGFEQSSRMRLCLLGGWLLLGVASLAPFVWEC